MLAKALHPWMPPNSNPGDLTFEAGTLIEVDDVNAPGGGWWTGHLSGEQATGIFPANYVKEITTGSGMPEPEPEISLDASASAVNIASVASAASTLGEGPTMVDRTVDAGMDPADLLASLDVPSPSVAVDAGMDPAALLASLDVPSPSVPPMSDPSAGVSEEGAALPPPVFGVSL